MTLTSNTDGSGGREVSGASSGTAAAAAAAAPSDGSGICSSNFRTAVASTGPDTRRSSRSRKRTSFLAYSSISASNTDTTTVATSSAVQPANNVNPAALSDRKFEKLLKQYEDDGVHERAEKKLRLERGYGDDDYPYTAPVEPIPFDSLPSPCIELVFEMLPTVRSVFNLAYQSKFMLSHVEERTDIIVRAAVHGNAGNQNKNQARRVMTNIINMVRNRSIHVPGPIRLLRLLCATRCERNENCWEFDLEKKLASSWGVDNYRPYCMALCNGCAKDVSHPMPPPRWVHWARTEEKVIIHGWNKLIHPSIAADLAVATSGEKVGPRINARQIHQIYDRHPGNTDAQKEEFDELVKTVYGEEGSEELNAYEKECTDLIDIFDAAETELESWLKERSDKKAEVQTRRDKETVARRKETLKPIIAALEAAVAEAPNKKLIKHEWSDNPYREVVFKVDFVRQAMSKLVSAPSSASRKEVNAVCTDVCRKLAILSENKEFWSLSFLSTAVKSSSGRAKRVNQKLLDCCKTLLPRGANALVRDGDHNINDRCFDLLEEDNYYDALFHILEARDALGRITQKILVSLAHRDSASLRLLVGEVWKKVAEERPRNDDGSMPKWTWTSFQESLEACRLEFITMKQNARDYLNEPAVKSYIANQQEENEWNYFTRERAANQVWRPANTVIRIRFVLIPPNIRNVRPYNLLIERDFVRLLDVHRFYVRFSSSNVH